MDNVVRLSDYRAAKQRPATRPGRQQDLPHYFCQRCDTDAFKLFASGEIHCACCGALIRNILVAPSPSSQGTGG